MEEFECQNAVELHLRERQWVDILKPSLNTAIPSRNRTEYYNDNKLKILRMQKKNYKNVREHKIKYYKQNRDKILSRMKTYYKTNRERILKKEHDYYKKMNKVKFLQTVTFKRSQIPI